MGDGTEIPWDLSPGTRVPGLGLGLGLIFVGLPGLGLIFVGQSRQRAGTGTENPGTWDWPGQQNPMGLAQSHETSINPKE